MDMPLWFSNLLFWSLQVALLVLAAALLARVLQLREPRVLIVYWRSLLTVSLLLPLLQPWHHSPTIAATAISDFAVPLLPTSTPAVTHWHLPNLQTLAPILGIVILAGIALRFSILALGLLKLRRLRQASRPIAAASESAAVLQSIRALLDAPAEFRLSSQVDSPVTFGFVAPVVLLPERFTSLELRFQSAIACHELLHVRRRDWAHHLVEEALRALFWFHPAIAWLVSRIRLAREQVVDLEVVRLTNARKSYLEALLEFTNARTGLSAIPAPPFLVERQLVERVSLMLKEVRMSQRRLIVSLAVISSCLALVVVLAAWSFPLKAQGPAGGVSSGIVGGVVGGVPGGIAPGVSGGVAQGIPGGVADGVSRKIAGAVSGSISGAVNGGIAGGISGGISGEISNRASGEEPSVDVSTIWTDTVKRGSMPLQVRGRGGLGRVEGSQNLVAQLTLPASLAADVRPNQNAIIDTHKGFVKGHVLSVSTKSSGETRTVNIALDDPLPEGAIEIDATIDIGKLDNVLFVGRPMNIAANGQGNVFKISNDGSEAVRTQVKFGGASVNTIEILDGLKEGDKVILSDMSSVANAERVRLTHEKH
ncbi:MAG TPA: M56 family metallopeptidase [Candidatus Acidoferrum sp.]|nr:M56 family metallopeptidase [Candidatus Acidoferrum sp.]